jgi:hypothetical protein
MLRTLRECFTHLWDWVTEKAAYEKIMEVSETTILWKQSENDMWDWILANPTLHIGWFESGRELVTKVIETYIQFLYAHPKVVCDKEYFADLRSLLNPPPWWPTTPKGGSRGLCRESFVLNRQNYFSYISS